MSNSRFQNSGKSELCTTIGFRFHANDEELEELQSDQSESTDAKISEINQEMKTKSTLLTSESLDHPKPDECKTELIGDVVKDQWNLLGRRSTSIDSNYESPFSNPIETWKKLNILKEKITKTVEEKISEMKMDRNVLSKTGRNKLMNSKENSSISDSEDTSESSKLSELWKDAEDSSSSLNKVSNESSEIGVNNTENAELEVTNADGNIKKSESELRNRKGQGNVLESFKLPNIKIATAKSELNMSTTQESFDEDVESGVEADENLYPTESDSFDFEEETLRASGSSQRPPSGGRYIFNFLSLFHSLLFSTTYTAVILICLILYYYFPMPDFAKGFVCCFMLMIFWEAVKIFFRTDEMSSFNHYKSLDIPDYNSLPPLKVPELEPIKGVWINEYHNEKYDPDYYSVTQTVSAYLELEGSILKLSRPKGKIHKRATFDEPKYKLNFISQRIYNISGCNVFLMPEGLTRKRLYSKKYPIVIFLKPDSFICEKKRKTHEKEITEEDREVVENFRNKPSLYLFARCDRQKEEWYRRLLAASRYKSDPVQKESVAEASDSTQKSNDSPDKEPATPFEHLVFDDGVNQLDEYYQYMVKFVDLEAIHEEVAIRQSSYKKKRKQKDSHSIDDKLEPQTTSKVSVHHLHKKPKTLENEEKSNEKNEPCIPQNQLQWFNAFMNRILFDVFRSPFWLNKIHDKVQRKLNSIRLPYYVEDIEVIELDLGKTGPVFHRASQPYLDERGLWFDMDTTFNGFIRITIQTHLNLIKLQKGFEEESDTQISSEKPEREKKKHKEVKETVTKESRMDMKEKLDSKICLKICKASCSVSVNSKGTCESRPEKDYVDVEGVENEECKTLLNEVAQLAEMAVEESLKVGSQKDIKTDSECPCTMKSRSPIYDSEIEDSAESSDEDDEEEEEMPHAPQSTAPQEQNPVSQARRYPKNRRSSKRLFRVFENVAQSKYFKSMAQSKYIQKAIAGVSAAKLRLTLELKSLTGILTINIPPPPSDRFWYGFREMPKVVFSANPKIGEKAVKFAHIKNYLQKKILYELKKVMVEPNMIDFVLPTSSPVASSNSTQMELQESEDQEETPTDI